MGSLLRSSYGGVKKPLCPVRLLNLSDAENQEAAAYLESHDVVIADYATVADLAFYPNQAYKAIAFTHSDDSDIEGIAAAAVTYGAKLLMYNAEGAAWDDILDYLIAVRAALPAAGCTLPLLFAPILAYVDSHWADYAPYCDGAWLQMWNPTTFPDPTLVPAAVDTRIATVRASSSICPIFVQLNCFSYTHDQTVTLTQAVAIKPDVAGIGLWFQAPANWAFCKTVLASVRP